MYSRNLKTLSYAVCIVAMLVSCNESSVVDPDSEEGLAHFGSSSSGLSSVSSVSSSSFSVAGSSSSSLVSSSSVSVDGSSSSVLVFSSSSSALVSSSGMVLVDNRTTPATIYPVVKIGAQYWMAKNLEYFVATETDSVNVPVYGRLYSWAAAKLVCPSGWHLPTDAEWGQLEMHIGMPVADITVLGSGRGTDEGSQLKTTDRWMNSGTDLWGFAALPGGIGLSPNTYINGLTVSNSGSMAGFWSATGGATASTAIAREMWSNDNHLFRLERIVALKYSVRCLRD